jgi:PTS system nitrogen regulatory IIA component
MIYVSKFLNKDFVKFVKTQEKIDVLNELIDRIVISSNILDKECFRKAVFAREEIISTGIGLGIAIPHVKINEVKDITICIGICRSGIEWKAIDNQPVHIIFLIAGAADQHELYLRILSKIILVLKKKERREKIVKADNADDILKLFKDL